jgi:hypothetical protein
MTLKTLVPFPAPDGRASRGLEANVFMFEAKREGVSVFGANGVRLPRIMAPATLHLYSHHHRLVLPRARAAPVRAALLWVKRDYFPRMYGLY